MSKRRSCYVPDPYYWPSNPARSILRKPAAVLATGTALFGASTARAGLALAASAVVVGKEVSNFAYLVGASVVEEISPVMLVARELRTAMVGVFRHSHTSDVSLTFPRACDRSVASLGLGYYDRAYHIALPLVCYARLCPFYALPLRLRARLVVSVACFCSSTRSTPCAHDLSCTNVGLISLLWLSCTICIISHRTHSQS